MIANTSPNGCSYDGGSSQRNTTVREIVIIVDSGHENEFHVHAEVDKIKWFKVGNCKQNYESPVF
jgi:hypothetical protein